MAASCRTAQRVVISRCHCVGPTGGVTCAEGVCVCVLPSWLDEGLCMPSDTTIFFISTANVNAQREEETSSCPPASWMFLQEEARLCRPCSSAASVGTSSQITHNQIWDSKLNTSHPLHSVLFTLAHVGQTNINDFLTPSHSQLWNTVVFIHLVVLLDLTYGLKQTLPPSVLVQALFPQPTEVAPI